MKTLIIANFPKEKELSDFKKKFVDELKRDDVIYIENPESLTLLEEKVKSYKGEFDRAVVTTHGGWERIERAVVRTHGGMERIPSMMILNGGSEYRIATVIQLINVGNEESVKKIHLTSCFIGSNFNEIEQKDDSSFYYSGLNRSLEDGQILFLHGDSYTGQITGSLDQRLKGIVESPDYSISEAVLDSPESMSVVKKNNNQLEAFSYQPFGRKEEELPIAGFIPYLNDVITRVFKTFSYQPSGRKEEEFSIAALRPYLNDVVTRARNFENDQGILNGNVSEQRLENLSEENLNQYLSKRFIREITKAIDANNPKMVEDLIKKADTNVADPDGFTALMLAAERGKTETAKLLLENEKTNPNIPNKDGQTALMYAVDNGHTEAAKLLLKNEKINPNIVEKDGCTALMYAAKKGQTETVELLLENKKTNPNIPNKDGQTALMYAVNNGQTEIAKLLLKKEKTDPNIRNKDGWTALMYAVDNGHTEAAKLLLEIEKIHLNIGDSNGWTALMLAADKGNVEIVEYLIKKGAIPEIQNLSGETAASIAKGENKEKITKLISEAIEKKHQNPILKKYESAISSEEQKEIRGKSTESSPNFLV